MGLKVRPQSPELVTNGDMLRLGLEFLPTEMTVGPDGGRRRIVMSMVETSSEETGRRAERRGDHLESAFGSVVIRVPVD